MDFLRKEMQKPHIPTTNSNTIPTTNNNTNINNTNNLTTSNNHINNNTATHSNINNINKTEPLSLPNNFCGFPLREQNTISAQSPISKTHFGNTQPFSFAPPSNEPFFPRNTYSNNGSPFPFNLDSIYRPALPFFSPSSYLLSISLFPLTYIQFHFDLLKIRNTQLPKQINPINQTQIIKHPVHQTKRDKLWNIQSPLLPPVSCGINFSKKLKLICKLYHS
jgi:hypothetical protein